jgi:hypothetical protein
LMKIFIIGAVFMNYTNNKLPPTLDIEIT